jgi:glycosyltransferase involved in cell wall biosynthesis
MGKIKILEILEATTGGTRKHLYNLLQYIDAGKFSVSLVYSDRRDAYFCNDIAYFAGRGVELFEVPMKREISPIEDLRALIRICGIIRANKFDIVHAHSSKAGVLGRIAARLAGTKMVMYSPHSFAFQYCPKSASGRLYRGIEKLTALFCDCLLCVSKGECKEAVKHRICASSKIRVLENAVATEDLVPLRTIQEMKRSLGISEHEKVVGMVAKFRAQKGYRHFIEAIPRILKKCSDTTFLIVGDGEERGKVERMIRELGLLEKTILTGHQENVADYYQVFDVFVLSSLWEGMPYVILEAMALGLPVVASDICGNNELVEHGDNGFLVTPGNSEEIAERVVELLVNPEMRRTFGERSRTIIASRPSVYEWIDQYQNLYTELFERERT